MSSNQVFRICLVCAGTGIKKSRRKIILGCWVCDGAGHTVESLDQHIARETANGRMK